jgi:hypothetical protein
LAFRKLRVLAAIAIAPVVVTTGAIAVARPQAPPRSCGGVDVVQPGARKIRPVRLAAQKPR